MTDSEKLDLILGNMKEVKSDISSMKTDIVNLQSDMREVKSDISSMKTDIVNLQSDMKEVKSDISSMKTDIVNLQSDMKEVKSDISSMKSDISNLKTDMEGTKGEIIVLRRELEEVKEKVIHVDFLMENELRVNIKRVAEGHLDLSRHLQEAVVRKTELEMLSVQVNILESYVKGIREKVS